MILKKEWLLANYWGGGSSPQLPRLLRPWIEFKSDKTGTIGLQQVICYGAWTTRCNSKEHSRLLIFLCVFLTLLRLCKVQIPPEPPSTTPLHIFNIVLRYGDRRIQLISIALLFYKNVCYESLINRTSVCIPVLFLMNLKYWNLKIYLFI
jgi:hypothetical protein